jgi:SAM-dependent MidA family methyltransferase
MTTGSDQLSLCIREEIEREGGVISFARYMELALYHPDYGYYNSPEFNLGKEGDFTTASEISPLFAQCFAHQCQQIMHSLSTPSLLELGAGSGRFAGDLLRELKKLDDLPNYYYIYEISPHLRKKQALTLQAEYADVLHCVVWLEALPHNFKGIIIANEVLDALPVHCFHIGNSVINERGVGWANNQFNWQLREPFTPELGEKVLQLQKDYPLAEGYESEINLYLIRFIQLLTSSLDQGMIIFSDYGYGRREYYHPERRHGTLTCFYQHRRHDNPFVLPGIQDITAHVDFTSVIEVAVENGCDLAGYTTQAAFLLDCGLMRLVLDQEKDLSEKNKFNLHHAVKLLTMPMEMGERIKIMALNKKIDLSLCGFRSRNRSREL